MTKFNGGVLLALTLTAFIGSQSLAGNSLYVDGIAYVNAKATVTGNGTSWAVPMRNVSEALAAAAIPANKITQIWTAQGTYKPAGINGDRAATYSLLNGVAVYGGFVGTELELGKRDPVANPTILSGDLNSNDAGFVNNSENSFHIVRALNVNQTAVLDGFRIIGGNANGASPNERGGGVWITNATPTIVNCTIQVNSAAFGGGTYCEAGSNVLLDQCTWSSNRATHTGGAVYAHVSSPTIVNSVFYRNEAQVTASAIRNQTSANTSIINCTFAQNNVLSAGGGAIFNFNSAATVRNTIMVDSFGFGSNEAIINGTGGTADVTHSAIPGVPGVGNMNPPAVLFDNPSPGNFRLMPGSPCIDSGNNLAVPAGVESDIYGNTRFANDHLAPDNGVSNGLNALVDMGAVERIPVDLNNDSVVNGIDLGTLLSAWGNPGCAGAKPCPPDFNLDGVVDGLDLGFMLFFWTF